MSTTKILYNAWPPAEGRQLDPEGMYDVESEMHRAPYLKFVEYDKALDILHKMDLLSLRYALICAPLSPYARKRALVDIKFHNLAAGELPALPGWHCDKLADPFHPSRPDIHHLLVTGYHCLTEFVKDRFEAEVSPEMFDKTNQWAFFEEVMKQRTSNEVISIKPYRYYTYGRFHFHRAVPADSAGKRLLIKITETDVVEPNA